MNTGRGMRRLVVVISVLAYAIAAICDFVFAFIPGVDLKSALIPAVLLCIGIGHAIFYLEKDPKVIQQFDTQPITALVINLWAVAVFAFGAAMYPIYGVQVWNIEPTKSTGVDFLSR